jgi:uncharacterized membrane protein YkoI
MVVVCLLLLIPGVIAQKQIPAAYPKAEISVAETEMLARSAVPHGQVLTVVPDVQNQKAIYLVRVRSQTGHLWALAINLDTGAVITKHLIVSSTKKPVTPRTKPTSPPPPLSAPKTIKSPSAVENNPQISAQDAARIAVGGGQVISVNSSHEDNSVIYTIKLLLANGQFAKVKYDAASQHVLSVKIQSSDH